MLVEEEEEGRCVVYIVRLWVKGKRFRFFFTTNMMEAGDGDGDFPCPSCPKIFGTERGCTYHFKRHCKATTILPPSKSSSSSSSGGKRVDDDDDYGGDDGGGGSNDAAVLMEEEGSSDNEDKEEVNENDDVEEIKNFAPGNFFRDMCVVPQPYSDDALTSPTLAGSFFHHQRIVRAARQHDVVGPLTATQRASVELVAMAARWNLSREVCDSIIRWGQKLGNNVQLPCFKTMKNRFDQTIQQRSPPDLYRRLEIPINPLFSATGQTSLTFECLDVTMLLGSLLTNEEVVSTPNDFLWSQKVLHTKGDPYDRHFDEMNTGEFWETTENEHLGGKQPEM